MTSFGRTKVKKTSKSDQVYRIRESLFSKGLQGYTRVSLAIKKIQKIEKLGIFNPRKNKVYIAEISSINPEVIEKVSQDIIGYK